VPASPYRVAPEGTKLQSRGKKHSGLHHCVLLKRMK